jgi:hypothetical protein
MRKLAFLILLIIGLSLLGCTQVENTDQTAVAPDGKHVAKAMERSDSFGGEYFVVITNGASEEKEIFDFVPNDSGPYQVRWIDSENLEIKYPGLAPGPDKNLYTKLDQYQGIKITYVECPVGKRKVGSKICVK